MEAFQKFKKTIKRGFNTQKQSNQTNQKSQLVIGDVLFRFAPDIQKKIALMNKKITQLYDENYLKDLDWKQKSLTVEIIGQTYFQFVINSKQKSYNHAKSTTFRHKFKKIFSHIYSNPNSLNHFWSIDFLNLKILNLSNHRLMSIEGVTFMNVPNLQCLELYSNMISNINCLYKTWMPKLRIITLYDNKAAQASKLTRLACKLKEYEFDSNDSDQSDEEEDSNKIQNLNFLFKMPNCNKLKKIYFQNEDRLYFSDMINKLQYQLSENRTSIKAFKPKRRDDRLFQSDMLYMIQD